ncbi:MAG: hypothetical protein GY847_02075 [Proteobacteria bacterium]|nr:hypothetical protein [Pseudomonadota bacterium]
MTTRAPDGRVQGALLVARGARCTDGLVSPTFDPFAESGMAVLRRRAAGPRRLGAAVGRRPGAGRRDAVGSEPGLTAPSPPSRIGPPLPGQLPDVPDGGSAVPGLAPHRPYRPVRGGRDET